ARCLLFAWQQLPEFPAHAAQAVPILLIQRRAAFAQQRNRRARPRAVLNVPRKRDEVLNPEPRLLHGDGPVVLVERRNDLLEPSRIPTGSSGGGLALQFSNLSRDRRVVHAAGEFLR